MSTILIVDDDASIVRGLEEALKEEQYRVLSACTGEKGLQLARSGKADLIILDLRLPDRNGESICRDLRGDGIMIPVLMLTSKREEVDKVMGLEVGADDYVTKPFGLRELLARVKALLRRASPPEAEKEEFTFGAVTVNFHDQEVRKGKTLIPLTMREFSVLRYFIQHEGEVVTRDMLLDAVWGYDQYPVTRTVDNDILSLRKKVETNHSYPRHFLTVHTAGYRFVARPD